MFTKLSTIYVNLWITSAPYPTLFRLFFVV